MQQPHRAQDYSCSRLLHSDARAELCMAIGMGMLQVRLTEDVKGEGHFWSALASFVTRTCFANVEGGLACVQSSRPSLPTPEPHCLGVLAGAAYVPDRSARHCAVRLWYLTGCAASSRPKTGLVKSAVSETRTSQHGRY